MTLFIDNREFRSKVPEYIKSMGVEFKVKKNMEVADYIIVSNKIAVATERKSAIDFLRSISDGRLNNQNYKMSTNFEYSIMAIEGDLITATVDSNLHINAVFSSLAGTLLRRSPDGKQGVISVIPTFSQMGTAKLIYYLHKKMESNHELVRLPHLMRIKVNENERAVSILSCFPRVGDTRSKNLLTHFGTLEAVLDAEHHELCRVKGVGKKLADNIIKTKRREYEVDEK